MSLTHKTFREFAEHVSANLDQYIATRRDRALEDALWHGFLLYSYVVEDCQPKATKNRKVLDKTGIMLIEGQDVLRGIVHGMAAVSPVVLATMLRVAIELRCNYRFIMSRPDPLTYADRYFRFGRVITLAHDEEGKAGGDVLTREDREAILASSPEWLVKSKDGTLATRKDGRLRINLNWTADPQFDSLKKIAAEVGLANDYRTAYGATSQAVHGSALVTNLYRDADGIHPVGVTAPCKRLAALGAFQCMRLVGEAADFFGIPFDDGEYAAWSKSVRDACGDVPVTARR